MHCLLYRYVESQVVSARRFNETHLMYDRHMKIFTLLLLLLYNVI